MLGMIKKSTLLFIYPWVWKSWASSKVRIWSTKYSLRDCCVIKNQFFMFFRRVKKEIVKSCRSCCAFYEFHDHKLCFLPPFKLRIFVKLSMKKLRILPSGENFQLQNPDWTQIDWIKFSAGNLTCYKLCCFTFAEKKVKFLWYFQFTHTCKLVLLFLWLLSKMLQSIDKCTR